MLQWPTQYKFASGCSTTGTKSNPPLEAQQTNRHGFLPSFYCPEITSPICPHCSSGEEMAEHLLLSCPRWAAERQRHFSESIGIKDVFRDYVILAEFLISSGHLTPHVGTALWARYNNNNNSNNKDVNRHTYRALLQSLQQLFLNGIIQTGGSQCFFLPKYNHSFI